jgi:hypothetical protein
MYWTIHTYRWQNDMDNHYYVQKPKTGNKYLFVFVQLQNNGDTRVWFPSAGSVIVHYNSALNYHNLSHIKRMKRGKPKQHRSK